MLNVNFEFELSFNYFIYEFFEFLDILKFFFVLWCLGFEYFILCF